MDDSFLFAKKIYPPDPNLSALEPLPIHVTKNNASVKGLDHLQSV